MYGLNQYRSAHIDTVGPEDSVALVYDGARRFVDKALAALEAGDYYAVSLNTGKAQQVIAELSVAINFDAAEMAENLFQLYDYWNWRLHDGLTRKDPEPFREVSAVLAEMREAWAEAARQMRVRRAAHAAG